jgi:hypothetical protein
MADFISFNEGRKEIANNGLSATCYSCSQRATAIRTSLETRSPAAEPRASGQAWLAVGI